MAKLLIKVGNNRFIAQLEEEKAPLTCAAFKQLLPFKSRLVHARWSGESMWIPLGDFTLGVSYENHTSYPSKGQILFHPGGISETEILLPYGSCIFASKVGLLAGNHFLTIGEGFDELEKLGRDVLWEGAREIIFEAYAEGTNL